jgi:transcriptional regulator with XRE-family HTH domain
MSGERRAVIFDQTSFFLNLPMKQKPQIMKQPELGRKIAEMRKARGLTQEELVEKCNISVRTIQRIESGDVTPRMYTVRTIIDNLDYDINDLYDSASDNVINRLNIAWIAGIIYFLVGFPEAFMEGIRLSNEDIMGFIGGTEFSVDPFWYVVVKIVVTVSFFLFMSGFYEVGRYYNHALMQISSVLLIVALTITSFYDVFSIFYGGSEWVFVLPGISITFGILGVVFAAALFQMTSVLGKASFAAGLMESMAAVFFLFLIPISFIFLIPAEIFEVIILYKAAAKLRPEQNKFGRMAMSE